MLFSLLHHSIPYSHALIHALAVDGVEIDAVVGEGGERGGEITEGGECLVYYLQGRGGGAAQTAVGEEGHGDEGLTRRASVAIEGSEFVGGLYEVVVGDDEAVVQTVVDGAVRGDAQHLHHDGIVTTQLGFQFVYLRGYVIESIGGVLALVVKDYGDMILASRELLGQELLEDVVDIGYAIASVGMTEGEEVAVCKQQGVGG